MNFRFIKIKGYDSWALVIENIEQLKEYGNVVAYPKACKVVERLVERIDHNDQQIKNGGYPTAGHWGDMLVHLTDMEIQKPENENMTVLQAKIYVCEIMIDPKKKSIDNGQPIFTYGFPFSPLTDKLEIVEEKIMDNIPVQFVEYYKTKDFTGIKFEL